MKKIRAIIQLMLMMIFLGAGAMAQTVTVKGKVLDPEGNTLPGTAITVQGTTTGAVSNDDGDYTIPNVPAGSILVFQLVGYVSQELRVEEGKTVYNAILLEESLSLDEVTVVAFSKQNKNSVMASITTVKPSELRVPSSNLTTAFAGRIAGLISYQLSGEPGQDNAQFFIRGVTSFGIGKKDPLILIDQVEMSPDDLARLTTDDIASFSVMKDANATALYGARGANGVILVTTKEGKSGPAKIQVRVETSLSMPTQMIDVVDPVTYMKLNNEAVSSRSLSSMTGMAYTYYSQEEIWARERGLDPDRYPVVDWMNMLFKDYTFNHRYNLNVSGGGSVVRYYVAASFNRDNGIINMDERNNFNNNITINKYALRSNINIDLTKTTEMIARLSASFDDYSGPLDGGAELFKKARNANPVRFLPYYRPDAANALNKNILFGNSDVNKINDKWYLNPYAEMVRGYKTEDRSSMSSQFELRQKLDFVTEGLTARALFNLNRFSNLGSRRSYDPSYYNLDANPDAYNLVYLNASENPISYLKQEKGTSDVTQSMYFETAVQYNRTFDKHTVSGLLVGTINDRLDTGKALEEKDVQLSLPYRNAGMSGRATYGYDNRYFFEFNFGYNGSERFSENERFGFFPSAGVGYLISNEKFMEPLAKTVTKLKLKATYGTVGNDQIGDGKDRFYYLSNVSTDAKDWTAYRFGRTSVIGNKEPGMGIAFNRYGDPLITWEVSHKMNLGFELELWKAFEIQLDYATDYKSKILQERIIPSTMGLDSGLTPKANVGEAYGQSVEVMVDYNKSFTKDIWMVARGTFTYASSEFKVVEEINYQAGPRRSQVGQKLSQKYGYIAERLFLDDDEVDNSPSQIGIAENAYPRAGDIKYKDINGDYVIDENDQAPIGYPTTPEINYGFGISAGYKNFDFSCFFSGQARSSFWINPLATAPFVNRRDGDEKEDKSLQEFTTSRAMLQYWADDYWNESSRNIYALWPRLSAQEVRNNTVTSTWFMRSGDFLRLKTLEMGYTLPQKWINAVRMKHVRIYASGTNLFVISKFKMWDPEMGENGLAYPLQRVFNLGVTVDF